MPNSERPFYERRNFQSAFPFGEVVLPPDLLAALEAFCIKTGDKPGDIIVDALALLFDEQTIVSDREIEQAFATTPWSEPAEQPAEPPAPQPPKPVSGGARP